MKWQPIETAPKDGTDVLVYQPKYDLFEGYTIDAKMAVVRWDHYYKKFEISNVDGHEWDTELKHDKLTHWSKLEPPEL
jgi:hypothetical protein